MNTIRIGGSERQLSEATESWIAHQVQQRRNDHQSTCVQVTLKDDGVDMILTTPECAGCGDGGRCPNNKEQEIFDLWAKRGLNQSGWAVGNLIAFTKQVQRFI